MRAWFFAILIGCGGSTQEGGEDKDASAETSIDSSTTDVTADVPPPDCRRGDPACGSGTACDFTDGKCKDPSSDCFLPGVFEPCPSTSSPKKACGPGLLCDGKGSCVPNIGMFCTGEASDAEGRAWATGCPCDRPDARCKAALLDDLNQPGFAGSPVNDRDGEGAFDLDFDDLCTAYAVTMISGPDYLRQMTPDGKLTTWTSTTNLNMGQVAVLRVPTGEFKELGDVAATYICCATCGCIETGEDGRLGVVRLDRTSTARPLPNVLPAKATTGAGPFGTPTLDTGPYALTWGADKALYAGNIEANGDFMRVDLTTKTTKLITTFDKRVTAAGIYDVARLMVATEGGQVHLFNPETGMKSELVKLPAHVTSIRRDKFTGRIYAEVASTPPEILEVSADGKTQRVFQTPPRLGRIALAPDNYLYHLSVYPAVNWKAKTAIVRWPLPTRR
jgi:hypothetical protein